MTKELVEILKYCLPLLILAATIIFILRHFAKKEDGKYKYDIVKSNLKLITPVRLQAYERLALLLERIKPEAIALREKNLRLSAKQMQMVLLKTVKDEFNHNLSQQVYISEETWRAVVNAKEQMVRLLNLAGTKMQEDSTSADFIQMLIQLSNEMETDSIGTALSKIKQEAAHFFGL
ncbi:MAG: hypothetical protein CSB06_01140 [Bacteroidia bacterium]|nr:MAG: hypothetical protein CSB06_01140 [Bacteroidia bacterium]